MTELLFAVSYITKTEIPRFISGIYVLKINNATIGLTIIPENKTKVLIDDPVLAKQFGPNEATSDFILQLTQGLHYEEKPNVECALTTLEEIKEFHEQAILLTNKAF